MTSNELSNTIFLTCTKHGRCFGCESSEYSYETRLRNNISASDAFYDRFENEIRRCDIDEDEKERRLGKITVLREKAKNGYSRWAAQQGIKHIFWNEDLNVEQTADEIAIYFRLSRALQALPEAKTAGC